MKKKVKAKVHWAPSGEWGNPKLCMGRYWSTDVNHTALINEVTCTHCLKILA